MSDQAGSWEQHKREWQEMQGGLPWFETSDELEILHSHEDESKLREELNRNREGPCTETSNAKEARIKEWVSGIEFPTYKRHNQRCAERPSVLQFPPRVSR
jgi:hypothetical protein